MPLEPKLEDSSVPRMTKNMPSALTDVPLNIAPKIPALLLYEQEPAIVSRTVLELANKCHVIVIILCALQLSILVALLYVRHLLSPLSYLECQGKNKTPSY